METSVNVGDVVVIQEKARSRARLFMPSMAVRAGLMHEWLTGAWTVHEIHPPTMEGETTLVSLRPANMPKEEGHIGWPPYSYCTIESSKVEKAKKSAETDDFDWKAAEEAVRHFESLGEWRGKDRRSDPAGDVVLRASLGEINDREDAKHAAVIRRLYDKSKKLAGRQ